MVKKKLKTYDERRMPFWDHLEELRWRLIRCIVSVVALSIVAYVFSTQIMNFLTRPFPQKLIFLTPTGGFMIQIKVSIFAGLILSLPVIFYQFWQFVAPGLLEKEKKYVPLVIFFTTLCFLTGAAFAYFVMIPIGLKFLLSFQTPNLVANITIQEYLSFVSMLILAFGVTFELPVLAYFLTRIGLLTPRFLREKRRYGIVVIVIVAAILTPPDVFSQILLSIPLIVLYEVSIIVSAVTLAAMRKRKLQEGLHEAVPAGQVR